jgi:hypothetical protein
MPKYVIHIGPPKVGSKYLQTSMAAQSAQLLEYGICYPLSLFSEDRKVWHEPLNAQLRESPSRRLERIFAELNASSHRFVVFSFEGFFGLSEEQLRYLRKMMGECPVEIVYYVRRWSERIPSLWKQRVKGGFSETFPEMYCRTLSHLPSLPDYNNSLVWDKFATVFGRESLRLVSFNNLVDNKIDLVEHFLTAVLGVPVPPVAKKVDVNHSPNAFNTEILRVLNALHVARTGDAGRAVKVSDLKQLANLDVSALVTAMQSDVSKIAINDAAPMFRAVYRRLEKYQDRLVSPEIGTGFFAPKSIEHSFVTQDYLLDPAVIAGFGELYENLFAT